MTEGQVSDVYNTKTTLWLLVRSSVPALPETVVIELGEIWRPIALLGLSLATGGPDSAYFKRPDLASLVKAPGIARELVDVSIFSS